MINRLIISPCLPRTGSTFLWNALCGLINPTLPYTYVQQYENLTVDKIENDQNLNRDLNVIKTHIPQIKPWLDSMIDAYFVSIERQEFQQIVPMYRDHERMLIFQYEDILTTKDYSLEDVVENLYTRCRCFFPDHITLSKEECLKRLIGMNDCVSRMQNQPFDEVDSFFGIHGQHRNRPQANNIRPRNVDYYHCRKDKFKPAR